MATYQPNRAGMKELISSDAIYQELAPHAAVIEARAKATAHVQSGRFRDSIHTEKHVGPSRVTIRVIADSDGAAAIEARDNVLGRAAG